MSHALTGAVDPRSSVRGPSGYTSGAVVAPGHIDPRLGVPVLIAPAGESANATSV